LERLVEFTDLGFELNDAKALPMVFCFEVAGTPFELVEDGAQGLVPVGISGGSELPGEPVPEKCDLFGEAPGAFFGVGELGAQALLGYEGAGRESPGAFGSGLTLTVAGGGDAGGQCRVGVEQ
jgi:hypothetical protein